MAATAASSTSPGPSESGNPLPQVDGTGPVGKRRHLCEDGDAELAQSLDEELPWCVHGEDTRQVRYPDLSDRLDCTPDRLGSQRHVDVPHTEVRHGVDDGALDRCGRPDAARFADPFAPNGLRGDGVWVNVRS